jgi:hypothetical protein
MIALLSVGMSSYDSFFSDFMLFLSFLFFVVFVSLIRLLLYISLLICQVSFLLALILWCFMLY